MPGRVFGDRQILFALHQRGEAGDVLALGDQAAGEVAGVAAQIILGDLDSALADRRGPKQIDREPAEMREARFGCGVLDRAADQRRGRSGVLMVGMPGPAGQRTCEEMTLSQFDIGGVDRRAPVSAPVGLVWTIRRARLCPGAM
jgi:hypothetical protein